MFIISLLGFFLGVILVVVCTPLKILQLGMSVSNLRDKRALKDEKKPDVGGTAINKIKEKRKERVNRKGLNNAKVALKTVVLTQMRVILGVLLSTGKALIVSGIMSAIMFAMVVFVLISSVSAVLVLSDNLDFSAGGLDGVSSGAVAGSADNSQYAGNIESSLKAMAEWYIANVNTYQNSVTGGGTRHRKYYKCDLLDGKGVGDDCTGFAGAFASLVAGEYISASGSGELVTGSSSYEKAGWKRFDLKKEGWSLSDLRLGDILARNGHAEVFVDESHSFGWGAKQTHYPKDASWKECSGGGVYYGSTYYSVMYRYVGK